MSSLDFSKWLQNRLDELGWTQADLARKSGLTTAAISRIMTEDRSIGLKSCTAIARALNIPIEDIMIAAGLLPRRKKEGPLMETIAYLSSQLDEADQEEVIAFIQTKKRIGEQRGKYRAARAPRPSEP